MTCLSAATALTQWAGLSHSVNRAVYNLWVCWSERRLKGVQLGMLMSFGWGTESSSCCSTSTKKLSSVFLWLIAIWSLKKKLYVMYLGILVLYCSILHYSSQKSPVKLMKWVTHHFIIKVFKVIGNLWANTTLHVRQMTFFSQEVVKVFRATSAKAFLRQQPCWLLTVKTEKSAALENFTPPPLKALGRLVLLVCL